MYRHSVYFSAALAVLYTVTFAEPARAQETLVINTTVSVPLATVNKTGVTDLQLQEAFRRAGIGLEITHVPAERALINADKGIDDGTSLRVAGVLGAYPNLIQVPEKFMDYEFVAVSKNREIRIEGWDSLLPYSLGFITGWKIIEENTKNVKTVTEVKSVDQLFRLLELDRADIIIFENVRSQVELRKNPIEGAVILKPPVVRKPMFLYLNVRHKKLIPRIVEALRASKADGTHERLRQQALQPYLTAN